MLVVKPDSVSAGHAGGAVHLAGIVKRFGGATVLQGIGADIRAGEFLTVLGASGCGKSTLLRIIAGLERQSAGSVMIDGRNVDALRPDERDIAMVFQSYALYPHLTVFENVAVPLRLRRLGLLQRLPGAVLMPTVKATTREIGAAVRTVAATLRIENLLDRKPSQLSGGQKQRVALARAMVRNPKAFLMDEPLSNLDAELRVHMRSEIAQLHRQLGATFIYVTHDQAEAMTMSDRVMVIDSGEALQIATPRDIYEDPEDLRVARFVGTPRINVLPAVARTDGIDVLGMNAPLRSGLAPGASLQVALRPARLVASCGEGGLTGRLVHQEYLGSDLFLHVGVPGTSVPLIARCDPQEARSFAIGKDICLSAPAEHMLLFGDDGRRLRPHLSLGSETIHV